MANLQKGTRGKVQRYWMLRTAQCFTCLQMHAAPDVMAPTLSHFWHSLSQLLTRLVGQQMMTRLAMGSPPRLACPDTRRVHSRVMPYNSEIALMRPF